MATIEISDELYEELLRRITSFGETAEEVIQRLLAEAEGVDRKPKPLRATPGSILPEKEYWRHILSVLVDAGGSGAANDVINALWGRMGDSFKPLDLERLEMGEVRWRNRARFARLRMTQQGLLDSKAPRGIWMITEAGRKYLAAESET
jgi:Mrr N-terminal domain/SeqA protein N-terminal domain